MRLLKKFTFATLAALAVMVSPAKSAQQPTLLYATTPSADGTKLLAISLQAGRVRIIGDIGFPNSASLAFCRPGGVQYTITDIFNPDAAQLATLNLGTGKATPVGSPLGQNLSIMGMTCSPDGTLYAIGQFNPADDDFNSLYTIDRETGFPSLVGSTGVGGPLPFSGFLMALAFAPDGTLYGVNVSSLFRVDPSTGHAEKVLDFSGVSMVMGLAIDGAGHFYLCDYMEPTSSIYALNVITGVATPILDTGLPRVHNIAFKGAPIKE
jgi:hypothetical protein